jgi:hypothetical protein
MVIVWRHCALVDFHYSDIWLRMAWPVYRNTVATSGYERIKQTKQTNDSSHVQGNLCSIDCSKSMIFKQNSFMNIIRSDIIPRQCRHYSLTRTLSIIESVHQLRPTSTCNSPIHIISYELSITYKEDSPGHGNLNPPGSSKSVQRGTGTGRCCK